MYCPKCKEELNARAGFSDSDTNVVVVRVFCPNTEPPHLIPKTCDYEGAYTFVNKSEFIDNAIHPIEV